MATRAWQFIDYRTYDKMFDEKDFLTEEWRDVKGFEPFYQVSSLGRVKSKDRVIIRRDGKKQPIKSMRPIIRINHWGYPMIALSYGIRKQKHKFVHRIVAETFLENPNPELYDQINHIDGNKYNNRVSNLEWTNNSLNQKHAYRLGLHTYTHKLDKKIVQFNDDGNVIKVWDSIHQAEKAMGGKCLGHIWGCLKGNRKHCKGFKWQYYDMELHGKQPA